MELKIPRQSNLVVTHSRDYMNLEIEETNDLKRDILNSILEDDGVKALNKCLDKDCIFDILDYHEDSLHEYLESHGYIFNKA